jgi:hypothetical protein
LLPWFQQFAPEQLILIQSEALFDDTRSQMDSLFARVGLRPLNDLEALDLHVVNHTPPKAKAIQALKSCTQLGMHAVMDQYFREANEDLFVVMQVFGGFSTAETAEWRRRWEVQ